MNLMAVRTKQFDVVVLTVKRILISMMDHEYCRILIKSTPFTPMFSCFKNSLSLSAYTHWSSIFYPTPSIFAVTLARAEVPSIDSEFVVIARKFLPTGYTRNNITACLSDGFSVIRDSPFLCVQQNIFESKIAQ